MIENYIKEADRVTYLMPKEVDHHCAGQIIAELDALIEGCGVRKIVFDMKQTEFMDSSVIFFSLALPVTTLMMVQEMMPMAIPSEML